jgi:prolyl-tRNA synthetase
MAQKFTTREENYSQWYNDIVKHAQLAENSSVRGSMVIKPYGYALWENMQKVLDQMFKDTGHENAYFPLFIPKSFFSKEASHVEGFAKECAVVTHYRLRNGENGIEVDPDAKLEEELIVRPTSETIIWDTYKRWVQSYRDLPIMINQWANVVRWEMRTRLFLRTAEFLWQEGHTAHATSEEAIEETMKMLDVYVEFAQNTLAIPVIKGRKTESEKFPGALETFCIEAMMQDKKALQAGTSHYLGQNFAKASGIKYQSKDGIEEFAWTTSWGVSTRLIGALIMTHSDDNGLVLPPKIAPSHVVFIPIYKTDEERELVLNFINPMIKTLKKLRYDDRKVRVELDDRDMSGGEKGWYWIKKGIPLRVEVGKRDVEKDSLFIGRRDQDKKFGMNKDDFLSSFIGLLDEIQDTIYQRALDFRKENSFEIDDKKKFYKFFTPKNAKKPKIHGGFVKAHWCGSEVCEAKVKEELKVTIRAIPLDAVEEEGRCIYCGEKSNKRVIFAKSY